MDVVSYLLGKQQGGGGTSNLQNKDVTITENGNTNVSADTGYDGLGNVGITTNVQPSLETLQETITTNGTTTYTPSQDKDGFGSVEITTNVSADLSEYLGNTINNSSNDIFGVANLIKKLPAITITTTSAEACFKGCDKLTEISSLTVPDNLSNCNSMFYYCMSLTTVPQFNTSNVTNMSAMFSYCTSLTTLPVIDTSNATNLWHFAQYSSNLENVPIYNLSKATNFNGMFSGCDKLTDTSLDNILQMCISATSFTGNKTLVYIGFGSWNYSASRIQALPHYNDFINAGWSIGY